MSSDRTVEDTPRPAVAWWAAQLFQPEPAGPYAEAVRRGDVASALAGLDRPEAAVRRAALHATSVLHDCGRATEASVRKLLDHARRASGVERRDALIALGRARVPGLNAGFVEMLRSPDARHVRAAAYALGGARHRPAGPALAAVAAAADPVSGPAAVWALGQLGAPAALPTLHRLLRAGRLVLWVSGALGDIGAAESLDVLLDVRRDLRPQARFLAAAAVLGVVIAQGVPNRTLRPPRRLQALRQWVAEESDGRALALLTLSLAAGTGAPAHPPAGRR